MLEFKNIDKIFPGIHALKSINLHINDGEIIGLVGENGAGKSTLMKVLYGSYQHDGGEIIINGESVQFKSPRQAMEKGIGMVFQEQSLITNLTVMENIFLGSEKQFIRYGIINWQQMAAAAKKQLSKVKLSIDPKTITSDLSFAQRQLVELAKVLTLEERVEGNLVILLDEPTSVLAREEVELLFDLVRELRVRASFVFVSHRMDEVLEISDRIYIMRDGEIVGMTDRDVSSVEEIQQKMVGREIDSEYYRENRQKPYNKDSVLLEFKKMHLGEKYSDISFKLHAGEVLTLVGVEGSGREPILRTIFGLEKAESGIYTLRGKEINVFSAFEAAKQKIGYVPRERKIEGVVGGMSVSENMTLSQMRAYSSYSIFHKEKEKSLAHQWIKKLSIKTPNEDALLDKLSGGNQQKVVLSKWRSAKAEIMLLDHPTRGLDIGAKEDVYDMVREMSIDGVGIILIADTLEEAIGLSHSILVLKEGKAQKFFDCPMGNKPTLFDLLHYMV